MMNGTLGITIICCMLIYLTSHLKTDESDKDFWNRSGMFLYTDYGTGCQYLAPPSGILGTGTLTKRVDKLGKHICNKE